MLISSLLDHISDGTNLVNLTLHHISLLQGGKGKWNDITIQKQKGARIAVLLLAAYVHR